MVRIAKLTWLVQKLNHWPMQNDPLVKVHRAPGHLHRGWLLLIENTFGFRHYFLRLFSKFSSELQRRPNIQRTSSSKNGFFSSWRRKEDTTREKNSRHWKTSNLSFSWISKTDWIDWLKKNNRLCFFDKLNWKRKKIL